MGPKTYVFIFPLVAEYVGDPVVLDKVCQYHRRFVSDGGIYVDIERGISLGCPLSPLMGALYLKPLDDKMAAMGCFYVRYMDVGWFWHRLGGPCVG